MDMSKFWAFRRADGETAMLVFLPAVTKPWLVCETVVEVVWRAVVAAVNAGARRDPSSKLWALRREEGDTAMLVR